MGVLTSSQAGLIHVGIGPERREVALHLRIIRVVRHFLDGVSDRDLQNERARTRRPPKGLAGSPLHAAVLTEGADHVQAGRGRMSLHR